MALIHSDLLRVEREKLPTGWICPHCSLGPLSALNGWGAEVETPASRVAEETGDRVFQADFATMLSCQNPGCRCGVAVIGQRYSSTEYVDSSFAVEHYSDITIRSVLPSPHLFPMTEALPPSVRNSVTAAFDLYWLDLASAANRIRMTLEIILKEKHVPKKGRLHEWISGLAISDPKEKSFLETLMHSVKWLGNSGSHEDDRGLDRQDILHGFELLEAILAIAFFDAEARFRTVSGLIDAKHKP